MKKIKNNLASFMAMVILFSFAQCQGKNDKDTINPTNAINYVGKVKTVCGSVANANYASRSRGGPTFINLDKPYPNQVFTILIWDSDREKFSQPPEKMYRGKNICVSGKIIVYRGVAEIIIKDPKQIVIH